ncbi:MAG: hypothetical protein AAF074_25945 [Pseudomonadota bacterium]
MLGTVDDAPDGPFEAATSVLVMHFLPDDGAKRAYLAAIRQRLRAGALYIHVDVCVDSPAEREAMVEPFLRHAALQGLPAAKARIAPRIIRELPVISEARTRALLAETGFGAVTAFFRGLWYAGWVARAAGEDGSQSGA